MRLNTAFIPALIPVLTLLLGHFGVALRAAEQPLGVVEKTDKSSAIIHFDASVKLLPGSMVAIYGPGQVKKHPLTKEVLVEDRALVAKAQVIDASNPAQVSVRLTWTSAVSPAIGFDVVPLPKEAAPNAAPALVGTAAPVSAAVQSTVKITLPVSDPDGDTVAYSWSLEGVIGQSGTLSARTGTACAR